MPPDPFAGMTLVDLSLPIHDDAPIWSPEPKCIVRDWIVMGRKHGTREPLNMKYYCMSGHQGTHTDAPYHLNGDGRKLGEIPLSRFMGWCKVLDFTEKKLGDHFTAADLERRGVKDGDRILLHTGWDRYLRPFDEMYFNMDHPHFSEEAILWALEHKIQLIGMDVPSTDPYLVDHPKIFQRRDEFPIILELMTNLDVIVGKEVYLMALPLNLKDADGSWVRAVAFVPR
ncbi:MAG: cyclase family protein [Planctomycetes bacterium]|nr:cyclase family protein [Planctomycetota bacterium]